jgi:hypothetical protein
MERLIILYIIPGGIFFSESWTIFFILRILVSSLFALLSQET